MEVRFEHGILQIVRGEIQPGSHLRVCVFFSFSFAVSIFPRFLYDLCNRMVEIRDFRVELSGVKTASRFVRADVV